MHVCVCVVQTSVMVVCLCMCSHHRDTMVCNVIAHGGYAIYSTRQKTYIEIEMCFFKSFLSSLHIALSLTHTHVQLYDLISMSFKYQLMACPRPEDIILVTLNHLDSLKGLVADSQQCREMVHTACRKLNEVLVDHPSMRIPLNRGHLSKQDTFSHPKCHSCVHFSTSEMKDTSPKRTLSSCP